MKPKNKSIMTLAELADSIIVIDTTANNQRSFQMANGKFIQFVTGFDPNQMTDAGNQAFQKAFRDDNTKALVNPENVSKEQPLSITSQQIELALPSDITTMDLGIKVCFLIAQAQGVNNGVPVTDAFTLDKFGVDKIMYTFTDGGQWPT